MNYRLYVIFVVTALAMTACGSMSKVGASIQSASDQVNEIMEDVYSTVVNQPILLGVRKNPCGCDDALEFEVDFGGQWRHVFMADSPDLTVLRSEAQQRESGEVFDFYFDDTQEVYVSGHGQKFYVLKPIVLKQ